MSGMRSGEPKQPTIRDLLRPHSKALALGLLAAIGGAAANLLEPFPLKLVLHNVLRSRPATGWLNQLILSTAGAEKLGALEFAAALVLVIAAIGATCSY